MRILTVHNKYVFRGGEDESREAEDQLLRSRGHDVEELVFDNHQIAAMSRLAVGIRASWSPEAYAVTKTAIRRFRPHVLDVHNFFPLASPAVYYAAQSEGVGVVQTLHNFRLLCPGATLFRRGAPCEECVRRSIPWPSVIHACYRRSRAASAAIAIMITSHRLLKTWSRQVDLYVALTSFGRKKFIEGGLPGDKIVVKQNFVPCDLGFRSSPGDYAIYVGRLSAEKGLDVLIRAWSLLQGKCPLKIVGEGPLAGMVEKANYSISGITMLGKRPLQETYDLIGGARFLVLPSMCYEGMPRALIEAFCRGTPVIASKHGSMVEMIQHGRTGLLFPPGNPGALASSVEWAMAHEEELAAMRLNARSEFEAKYTAEQNYRLLVGIYNLAIEKHEARLNQ